MNIDFESGIAFSKNPCEIEGIGHDIDNPIIGYDLQGTIAFICPRPFCMELMDTVAVDDLPRNKFDELQAILAKVAASENLHNDE